MKTSKLLLIYPFLAVFLINCNVNKLWQKESEKNNDSPLSAGYAQVIIQGHLADSNSNAISNASLLLKTLQSATDETLSDPESTSESVTTEDDTDNATSQESSDSLKQNNILNAIRPLSISTTTNELGDFTVYLNTGTWRVDVFSEWNEELGNFSIQIQEDGYPVITILQGDIKVTLTDYLFLPNVTDSGELEHHLTVTSVNPKNSSTDVFHDATVIIEFSHEIDPNTVNEKTVVISGGNNEATGWIKFYKKTLSYIVAGLQKQTQYTITLKKGIRSKSGFTMESDYSTSFTTGNTNSDGSNPLPENFNPLGTKRFTNIRGSAEYVIMGTDYYNDGKNINIVNPFDSKETDDKNIIFKKAGSDADGNLGAEKLFSGLNGYLSSDYLKKAITANLDDDFQEEIAIVSWKETSGSGRFLVYDLDNGFKELQDLEISKDDNTLPHYYDIVSGDLDSDGMDEIIIVGCVVDTEKQNIGGKLWVFDDQIANYNLIGEQSIDTILNRDIYRIEVTVGNLDSDPAQEFAIAYTPYDYNSGIAEKKVWYQFYDDATENFSPLFESPKQTSAINIARGSNQYETHDLKIGDVDGDGLNEIVIGMHVNNSSFMGYLYVIDDFKNDYIALELPNEGKMSLGTGDLRTVRLILADLDRDGAAEIFFCRALFNDIGDNTPSEEQMQILKDFGHHHWIADAADMNGDGRADLVLYQSDINTIYTYAFIQKYTGADPETHEPLYANEYTYELINQIAGLNADYKKQDFLLANVDTDSFIVENTDIIAEETPTATDTTPMNSESSDTSTTETETEETQGVKSYIYFSPFRVIAIVSAPPCDPTIGQNIDDCSSTLGFTDTYGLEIGGTMSARVGVMVGIQGSISTGGGFGGVAVTEVASWEASITAQIEATASMSFSTEVSKTISWSTGYEDDMIIVAAVPIKRYLYHVASSPESEKKGKVIYIDFPMQPRIFPLSRSYFNAVNEEQRDIDDDFMHHTPGDISSYPTVGQVGPIIAGKNILALPDIEIPEEVNDILAQFFPSTMVGEGSGSTEVSLGIAGAQNSGAEVTLSLDVEGKFCTASVCAGASAGSSSSVFTNISVGKSVEFTAEIGNLNQESFNQNMYTYGIFGYLDGYVDDNQIQNFVVVNYWIQ